MAKPMLLFAINCCENIPKSCKRCHFYLSQEEFDLQNPGGTNKMHVNETFSPQTHNLSPIVNI